MKKCPKCGLEHTKTGVYCSRACANSRTFTAEARKKKQIANQTYWNNLNDEQKEQKVSALQKSCPTLPVAYLENLMSQNWEVIGIQGKRLRVIIEQRGRCNKCGLSEWLGEPLTLEFEHKDGDNTNNSRDNVEALCPNCHSQTSTWRGRKNKKLQKRVEKYVNLRLVEAHG